MIKYYCPRCSQKLGVPDNYAGHRVRCSKCNQPGLVPSPASDELELVEEPAAISAAHTPPPRQKSASFAADALSSNRSNIDAMETGPDPLALAAARAAHERKYTKALLQSSSSGGLSVFPTFGLGNIPLPLRIPLALATSIVLALAVGLLWAWVASISGWIFGIFCLLSAGAAAWGLTLYSENRSAGLGVVAVVLGFAAILFGKYMVGKWAVMPTLQRYYEKQMTQGGGLSFMLPDQLLEMIADDEQMLSIACVSLIRSGDIDEMQGRLFIVEQETKGLEITDLPDDRRTEIRTKSAALRDGWNTDQKKDAALRHSQYVTYAVLTTSRTGKAVGQGIAFAGTFSLWDVVLIPMALVVAFKTGAGRS